MSDTKAAEPSIEDILASIRKIISDDEPAAVEAVAEPAPVAIAEPPPAPPEPEADPWAEALAEQAADEDEDDDILDLTEIVPEPTAPEPEPEPEPVVEPIVERPPVPQVAAPVVAKDDEALASPETVHAAADAFARLAHPEPKQPVPHISSPADGKSVEDLVRELLRPLLREWIDGNLPVMVETLVQKELQKIARRPDDF